MGKWFNFLCLCVEDVSLAQTFGRLFEFTGALNAVVESNPGFGQLGCSGLVLLDAEGKFLVKKSQAFLQYGDAAFQHFEKHLYSLLPAEAIQNGSQEASDAYTYTPGSEAVIEGLKARPELNGAVAVVKGFNTETGRFSVQLPGTGEIVAVRPCCLAPPDSTNGNEGTTASGVIEPPPLVNVDAMDHEHTECTEALNTLVRDSNKAALQQVHDMFVEHFEHEEQLMQKHGFGQSQSGAAGSFSALASHTQDHRRILQELQDELSKHPSNDAMINAAFVQKVAMDFVSHATNFDSLYEQSIPKEAS